MRAMILRKTGFLKDNPTPLEMAELPKPTPGSQHILIHVAVCGVCHTELDEIEGRTPPPHLPIVLGHEVVGTVTELGENVAKHKIGDRVGVGWI